MSTAMSATRPAPELRHSPARAWRGLDVLAIATHACAALLALAAVLPSLAAESAPLRMNQLQYIGSHNSYHAGLAPGEAAIWKRTDPALFARIDYAHPPLAKQLDDGVRQIELDIYADAKGGRYAHPA